MKTKKLSTGIYTVIHNGKIEVYNHYWQIKLLKLTGTTNLIVNGVIALVLLGIMLSIGVIIYELLTNVSQFNKV